MRTYITTGFAFLIVLYVLWNLKVLKPPKFKNPFSIKKEIYPSTLETRLSLVSITIVALLMFAMNMDGNFQTPAFPVYSYEVNYAQQQEINFEKVAITNTPFLVSKEGSVWSNFIALAINENKAFLNGIVLLIVCIVATTGFWNFDFKDPFKIKLSRTFYQIAIVIIAYGIISYLFGFFANHYAFRNTNNKFLLKFDPFSEMFKVWLGVVLLRIAQVFRNAEKLREEQALTV